LVLILLSLSACGGGLPPPDRPEHARVVDMSSDREVTFLAMVDDLASARVAYVGEQHDDPAHHAAELAVIRALYERDPSLAVGVEMVQKPYQAALDAWVSGEIDEAVLLSRSEWATRWGYDFALYRDIFVFCREHRVPMVALNAKKELTRAIARSGIDGLDESMRAELPELVLDDAEHRTMIRAALEGHPNLTDEFFERMYAAQVTWDETMADRVAATMTGPAAPHRMVVIAGAFHVEGGLGIPKRAARRGAAPFRVVLPVSERDDDPGELRRHRDHYRWALWSRPTTS
jgi:uncharacterized iron-regulated protein